MYMTKPNTYLDSGEPQMGESVEATLVIDDGEGLDVLIGVLEETQSVEDTFEGEDEGDGGIITLRTSDYISSDQIDMLNEMFMADNDWDRLQIEFILESLKLK